MTERGELTIDDLFSRVQADLQELRYRVGRLPRPKETDALTACLNWVEGHSWDKTLTDATVRDEVGVICRKIGKALPDEEVERVVAYWRWINPEMSGEHGAAA